MDVLHRFEQRTREEIDRDRKIDVDAYESVSRYDLVIKIKKAIGMAFRKDWPRSKYALEEILKPGKLF